MINVKKLTEIIDEYKKYFPDHWKDEKYKWEAIQHFQQCWDINAENFLEMFLSATDKTYNLLASMNNYPRGMIKAFATVDAEAVRGMFLDLFDESKNLAERIDSFKSNQTNYAKNMMTALGSNIIKVKELLLHIFGLDIQINTIFTSIQK